MKKSGSLEKALKKHAGGGKKIVRVGFIDDATYTDGTPVALVAFWNEYGASINVDAHEKTIYRSIKKNGDFNKNGKFVKRGKSNFSTTHHVEAYQINIPPRPFFRHTIAENKSRWVRELKKLSTMHPDDKALALIGEQIQGDFRQAINTWTEPANSPYTVKKKGFDAPLRETMLMSRSINYEVDDES